MLYGNSGRQKKERRKMRRSFPYERFTRTSVEIQVQETKEVIRGRIFLNDLTPEGVGIFLSSFLKRGDLIVLVIENERKLYVKGEVVWCQPYAQSIRVLSAESYPYRLGIRFHFEMAEDQQSIRKYCEELAVRVVRTAA